MMRVIYIGVFLLIHISQASDALTMTTIWIKKHYTQEVKSDIISKMLGNITKFGDLTIV